MSVFFSVEKQEGIDLTTTCFSFAKRAIYHEPEECIRHASRQPSAKSALQSMDNEELNEQMCHSPSSVKYDTTKGRKLNPVRVVVSDTKIIALDTDTASAEQFCSSPASDKASGELLATSSQSSFQSGNKLDDGICSSNNSWSEDQPISSFEMLNSQSSGNNLTTCQTEIYLKERANGKSNPFESLEDNGSKM
jgi:hypothetical protein